MQCRQLFSEHGCQPLGFPLYSEDLRRGSHGLILKFSADRSSARGHNAPGTLAEATMALRRKWLLPAGCSHRVLPRNAEQPGKRGEAASSMIYQMKFSCSCSNTITTSQSLNFLQRKCESHIFCCVKGLILIFHVLLHELR